MVQSLGNALNALVCAFDPQMYVFILYTKILNLVAYFYVVEKRVHNVLRFFLCFFKSKKKTEHFSLNFQPSFECHPFYLVDFVLGQMKELGVMSKPKL